MKNLIILAVVGFLAFKAYQGYAKQQRERLVGVWEADRTVKGIAIRAIMKLKPEGDASVVIDGSFQGRVASKETFGKWDWRYSYFIITFDHGELPPIQNGKKFGGKIQDLRENSLTYKGDDGKVETWERVR